MTVTPKVLVAGVALTGSVATYYTTPAGKTTTVKSASVTNTTAGVVAVTVNRVPSGGSATAANTVISARNVAVGETYNCPELINKVLAAGDTLQALGLALSLDVSGAESVV
jgi:hypothetical protein